ncbi:MAG: hotdog fold thioesterase [Candidatus Lokiarchaeota archaeon]|jgi:uncharacterized protein (TIGR00369 family)|nr:hotdog fold thioesterase [Candidatus Lokiarchaeota archaeon]
MDDKRITFLKKDFSQGFPSYCGCKADFIDEGVFHSSMIIENKHKQQDGFVHAGVIATMADHTAGYSAYTLVPDNVRILTIEFKINYFKPAIGEKVVCKSQVINAGKTIITSESNIFILSEEKETLISKAIVTLMAVPIESFRDKKRNQ